MEATMTQKKPRQRRPRPPKILRTKMISVRFTDAELTALASAAQHLGLNLATWVRATAIAALRAKEG